MENKKIDIFKYLIPVIAVVIIVESVMVVSGLMKKEVNIDDSFMYKEATEGELQSIVVEDEGDPKANFVFSVDNKEMVIGETYTVELDMLPKEDFSADAVDIYISYDSEAFDVSNLVEGTDMPKAVSIRVSDKRNVVLANFWFTEIEGYVFEANRPVNLMSFVVTPKKKGSFDFSMNREDSEVGISRIVTAGEEQDQVSSLSFSSDKLTVIIN